MQYRRYTLLGILLVVFGVSCSSGTFGAPPAPYSPPATGFAFTSEEAGISAAAIPLVHGHEGHPLLGGGVHTVELYDMRETAEATFVEDEALTASHRYVIVDARIKPIVVTIPQANDTVMLPGKTFIIRRWGSNEVKIGGGYIGSLTRDGEVLTLRLSAPHGVRTWLPF